MFSAPTSGCSFWTVLHYLVRCSSEAEEEKWMTMPRMSRMRQEWEVFLLTNLGGLLLYLCNDEEAGSDVEHWNSAQLHQSINVYCPREVAQAPPVFYHLDSTTGAPMLPSGLCSESRMPVADHIQSQTLVLAYGAAKVTAPSCLHKLRSSASVRLPAPTPWGHSSPSKVFSVFGYTVVEWPSVPLLVCERCP